MQADARYTKNKWIESPVRVEFPCVTRDLRTSAASQEAFCPTDLPPFKFSARLPQTQGWAMKAHEFIDSGPPALLNNPCCCRRVVCGSFLNRVMEVQYG